MYHEYKYKKKHGVTIFKRPLNKVIDEYIDNLRKRVKSPAGNELFDFKALRSFV